MKELYSLLTEYEQQNLNYNSFCHRIAQNQIIVLKGVQKTVLVGNGLGLRVNSSIGLNNSKDYQTEVDKIHAIAGHLNHPDMMMDLSTTQIETPLYKEIQRTIGCPVGTIPYYVGFNSEHGIDAGKLLEIIEEQAAAGVSFMTLHLTADFDLLKTALTRNIPIISRGGSLLLRDIKMNKRPQNILLQNIDAIIAIMRRYNVAISIGTTFRPSTQFDALDDTHRKELEIQIELSHYLVQRGVQVMMEGIGHIAMNRIPDYCSLLRRRAYIPFMPLGPIVSDHTPGQDHITSSVGAAYLSSLGGADIINSVTREEHTGGIPTINSILEAIDAAKTVVQIVNESKFPEYYCKGNVRYHNCLNTSEEIGCTRCNTECPFILNEEIRREQEFIECN